MQNQPIVDWMYVLTHYDAKWCQILAEVKACYLIVASNHYLNQHWFTMASTRSCGIHYRVMFTWMLKIAIQKLCFEFTHFKTQPHLPNDKELKLFNELIGPWTFFRCHLQNSFIIDWKCFDIHSIYMKRCTKRITGCCLKHFLSVCLKWQGTG